MGINPPRLTVNMTRPANPILDEIEAFLTETSMAETTFGRACLNDKNLVKNLKAGRRLWPETEEKIREHMKRERAELTPAPTAA